MKIRMNKRGQVQYFLENAFRLGFLMIALLAFFLLVNFYIVNRIDTNRIQAEVTAARLIYSDAFMHREDSRTYIGIVDIKRFNDQDIEQTVDYSIKRHETAKLELVDNKDKDMKYTAYLNKAQYDILYTLSSSRSSGKGAASRYTKIYPVTYYDNNQYRYGVIKMTIIIPNS